LRLFPSNLDATLVVYSATKSGLRGFSIARRRELEPLGIGVTYAAPRTTRTAAASAPGPLVQAFGLKLDKPEAVAKLIWDAVELDAMGLEPVSASLESGPTTNFHARFSLKYAAATRLMSSAQMVS
jgi:short-subunit dehydrogenase